MTITPTPAAPSLPYGEDSGASDSDGVINNSGPVLIGQTLPNAVVTLYDNGNATGTATADANGFYTIYPYPVLDDGKHSLTITAAAPGDMPSAPSLPIFIVVDTSVPDPPTVPLLATTYDTGASAEDGITAKSSLKLTGLAEPGSTVQLYNNSQTVALAKTTAAADGSYILTTSALADGTYMLSVTATDLAGNVSKPSAAASITVDTTAPAAPGAPALTPATDTGVSHADGLTSDTTPVIAGTTEANATVTLFDAGLMIGKATADGQGNYVITASLLAEGAHALTVKATDAAGNVSAASAALNIVVDTATPVGSSTPDVDDAIFGSVVFNVHFSEAVSGLTLSALQLVSEGTATGEVTQITGGGEDYQVTVDGLSGAGSLRLALVPGNKVTNAAGNAAQLTTSDYYQYSDPNTPFSFQIGTYSFDGTSGQIGLSAGARLASFDTDVAETTDDTNPNGDVYVRDMRTGGITLISAGVDGSVHNGVSGFSSLSANGNVIVFVSTATGLVADGPTDGLPNVYMATLSTSNVADGEAVRITGITLVSSGNDQDGLQPALPDDTFYSNVGNYGGPVVSADGMHVVFSTTTPLIAGVTPGVSNVYEYDVATGDLTLITNGADGTGGSGESDHATVSGDGTMITYESGDYIYLYNVTANTTTLLNGAGLLNLNGNGLGVVSYGAQINSLGTWVTYTIQVGNNTSVVVNQNVAGANPNAGKLEELTPYTLFSLDNSSTVSMGGRYVAYELNAFGINNANPPDQVALTDSLTNSAVDIGPGTGPVLSADGNAIAYDNEAFSTSGGTTTDLGGQIVLTTLGPTVGIDPIDGDSELDATEWRNALNNGLTVTGVTDAVAGSSVRLQLLNSTTGALLSAGQATLSSDGVWSITLPGADLMGLPDGTYHLNAIASATDGASFPSNRYFTVDTQPPATPDAPKLDAGSDTSLANNGLATDQNTPAVTGTTEAGATVTLYDSTATTLPLAVGTAIADSSGVYAITVAALADGKHMLDVTATDAAGNLSAVSADLTITVDTVAPAAPTATLETASDTGTSDSDGITSNATPNIVGTAEAGSTVTLYDTDTIAVLGTAVVNAEGQYTIAASQLSEGTHSLTVTDSDVAGNISARSDAVSITVDTLPPFTPTITSVTGPLIAGKLTPLVMVSGVAEAGSKVTLSLDSGTYVLGETTAASDGAYSIESDPLPAGDGQTLAVIATDAAGNASQPSLPVDVNITDSATPPPGSPPGTPTLVGLLTDGPISGATVFADANGNGVYDPGEATAITNSAGQFTLFGAVGELVATGGTDSTTGLSQRGPLLAPAGSSVIDPLTTLLYDYEQQTGASSASANAAVAAAFGLLGGGATDLTTLDPNAAALSGSASLDPAVADGAAAVADAELADLAADIAAVVAGANTAVPPATIFTDVFQVVADAVANLPSGATLDLTDPTTLLSIIQTVATQSGLASGLDADAAAAAQEIIAAGNAQLVADGANDTGQALLTAIASVETVDQGNAARDLGSIGAHPQFAAQLVPYYTGAALADAVSVTAASIEGAPRLAAGSDQGLSDSDNITATLNPTFTGSALPGTYVTLVQITGTYANEGLVLGSAQADSSGHYTITSASLAASVGSGLYSDDTALAFAVVGSSINQNLTIGSLIVLPPGVQPQIVSFDGPDSPYDAIIEGATPVAAAGNDANDSALQLDLFTQVLGTVQIFADGGATPIATGTVLNAEAEITLITAPLSLGAHTLTITETLRGGTLMTSTQSYNVTITAPAVTAGTAMAIGAISGATITQIVDAERNAAPVITGGNGAYAATIYAANPYVPLTLSDGYDSITGLPIGGPLAQVHQIYADGQPASGAVATLTAPYNYRIISPFSTIVEYLDQQSGTTDPSFNAAMTLAAFGLNAGLDLTALDPLKEAQSGDNAPLLATIKLLDTATILSTLTGYTFQPFAEEIANGTPLNLDAASGIAALIAETGQTYGLTTVQMNEFASIIAAGNAAIDAHAASSNSEADTLSYALAAEQLEQSNVAALVNQAFNGLDEAPAGTDAFAAIVTADTGAALDQAITAEESLASQVTSLVPVGPTTTSANAVTFAITFGEAVTGLSAGSFELVTKGGLEGASITGISAVPGSGGKSYDVNVSTGIGLGTVALTYLGGGVGTVAGLPMTNGVIAPAVTYLPVSYISADFDSIAVGDFTGDGRPDAVLAGNGSTDLVTPFVNTGSGAFQAEAPISTQSGADYTESAIITDVNGDGKSDILVADYDPILAGGYGYPSYGGAVTVLLGNGDGGFGQAINTTLDFNPVDMVAGDFTGSGIVDIAMLDDTDNLHILLGTGTGSFTPVETLITGFNANNNPVSIVTGDFSDNGKLDLAVSSGNDGTVTIFMGNGDGTFTALAPIAVGDEPVALATGDFNGDGKTDLAVVDRGSNTVTVLLGKGDGTFSTGPSYVFDRSLTGVDDLTSIAVGDLNNDGVADLVVGSASQASVAVLLGNGNGTFRLGSLNMNGIGGAPALALGDVNGDGRTDILTTGRDGSPYLTDNGGLDVFTNEPETIVGSTSPTVTIARAAVAQPVLTQTSGPGTLTHTGNAYTLNFGTLTQGQAAAVVFALANTAAAPADSFDGLFSTPDGNGFTITGDSLPDAVAAGSAYNGLNFTADTTTSGSHSETITFAPRDATAITAPTATGDGDDASTLPPAAAADPDAVALELPPISLTVIDNVQGGTTPTAPAALEISSSAITLANTRMGATDRQAVTITNSAGSGSASLAVGATATGNATVSGSISGLAPQTSDATTLLAGLNTSAAGTLGGSIILTPVSEPDTSLPSQTLAISGSVFRAATASVAAISKIVHVGDTGSVALTVRNTDPADGFSEALDASITSATAGLSFTASTPVIIAAGASNAASLDIGFSTAAAGTITGTATLALATDGGTGDGSIDGLGQLALASDPVAVSVTVDNYAQASLSEVLGGGVLVRSGNNYTLNLGTLQQGASDPMIEIAALNAATGAADALSGSFQLAGSGNYTKTGFGNLSGLAAGASGEAGTVTLNTANPGIDTETITFNPNGTNASGYSGALPAETLTINAVVQAAPMEPPAVAEINTALPIAFGNVHLGASASRTLSISNIAQAPAASLDAAVSSLSGNAVAGGAIEKLAAGSTDATDITAGISTAAAGRRSGDVTFGFLSDNGGTTPLSNQSVAVSGTVYREAAASITPISEIVHVGDPGNASLLVSNTDPDDGYSENLVAMLAGTLGQIGVGSTSPTGEISANAGDTSLAVSFSTATAGVITGTAKVALTSDGGAGSGSIDGLGKTALSMANVPVTITVDNLAQAGFTTQGGTLTKGSTANSWTLDLGSATQGSSPLTASLSVLNAAGGPADLLGGSFTQAATGSFSNSGFNSFSGLAANGSTTAGEVSLAAGTAGSYSETIILSPTDTEGGLAATAQAPQTITVIGTITPQTASAQGDVHMVTFDGLHYDFQATGDFVLARATASDDSFQIQIRASEYKQNPGTSVTTEVAAQIGHDVVSFNLNQKSIVSVNGIADTSIAAGRGPQMLDGGELLALSTTQFEIEWNTGETLDVTRAGTYFNMSAGLSPQDGPGSVQGLLGGDNGQANDFALPDGTILPQPLPTSTLLGSFADAWRVAPASSLLNAGSQPSFGSMQFLNPWASNQIAAPRTGKILTGSASAQMLGSSIAVIASANAYLNTPNLKGSIAPSLQLNTAADLPYLGYASQSANILVAGTAPGASLWRTSIGHGGSLIAQ